MGERIRSPLSNSRMYGTGGFLIIFVFEPEDRYAETCPAAIYGIDKDSVPWILDGRCGLPFRQVSGTQGAMLVVSDNASKQEGIQQY